MENDIVMAALSGVAEDGFEVETSSDFFENSSIFTPLISMKFLGETNATLTSGLVFNSLLINAWNLTFDRFGDSEQSQKNVSFSSFVPLLSGSVTLDVRLPLDSRSFS